MRFLPHSLLVKRPSHTQIAAGSFDIDPLSTSHGEPRAPVDGIRIIVEEVSIRESDENAELGTAGFRFRDRSPASATSSDVFVRPLLSSNAAWAKYRYGPFPGVGCTAGTSSELKKEADRADAAV